MSFLTFATTTKYYVFGFGGCVRHHASLSLSRYSSSLLFSSVTNDNEASVPSNPVTVPRKFVPFPFQVRTYVHTIMRYKFLIGKQISFLQV